MAANPLRIGHRAVHLLLPLLVVASTLSAQTEEPPPKPQHAERHHGGGMHHDFSDTERFARRFENAERLAWQKPKEVIAMLALEPGMTVADLGAGTGFFLPYLAAAVGSAGRVLALDVEENMVAHMAKRVQEEELGAVEVRQVPYDDPELEAGTVDRILIVNTWHHIDDRGSYSAKLRDALSPGGRVFVVDFELDSPHGPPARHRLTAEAVMSELEAGGLTTSQVEEALPYQYVVVAHR